MPPSKQFDSPPTLDPTPTIDEIESPVEGVFEPPNGFVLTAIVRNKWIVALFALGLAVAGICFGVLRQSTYEASATIQVGQVNPNSPGFYGYAQSASSLATAFSRSIAAAPVLGEVQRKLKLPPTEAAQRLSSEPIPLSPAFRVIATGPAESDALRLANTAANAVIAYETKSNSANPQARSLLNSYRDASLALRQAEAKIAGLQGSESGDAMLRAEADKGAAQVRLKGLSNAYIASVESQAPRRGLVSLVAGATSASNDRVPKIELYGFVGLLLGIALGCLVAVLRERRRRPWAEYGSPDHV
ncbi:MAG TPA: Wzz/FepE/Etk N-terminal domain-containing protein [Solirubrobacterales bacterium]